MKDLELMWTCTGRNMVDGKLVEYTHHVTSDELRLARMDLFATVEAIVIEKLCEEEKRT